MVPLFVPSTSLLQSCFTAFSNLLSGFVLFDSSFGSSSSFGSVLLAVIFRVKATCVTACGRVISHS